MYHPSTPFPNWCVKCHLGDGWDALDYGKDYDFSRNFFEQFKDLKYSIPHRALDQNERNGEGCEYSNLCYTSVDSYLSYNVVTSEHIKYSKHVLKYNKNCLDSLIIKENDRGYELIQSNKNYNSTFLIECDQCIDSHFLFDCLNCINCCMSSNLRNKSNVFRNIQLTRDEYKKAIIDLKTETYAGQVQAKNEFLQMTKKSIHKYANIKNSVDIIGDFIENSKNVYYSYGIINSENVKHAFFGANTIKDSYDTIFAGKIEECYEFTIGGGGASKVILSLSCEGACREIYYCDNCRSCSDCFGCIGLKKKQYCILNKQYTKDEYFDLFEKIKLKMNSMPYIDRNGCKYTFGEFFPFEISPFAYNETVAFEENPLSKDESLTLGYKWKDREQKLYTSTMKSFELPESINDILDTICDEIIECPNMGDTQMQCTFAYKILPDELLFYRQMNLPIPRYCPNCRYHNRLIWKNPFHFYKRKCMCKILNHNHNGDCMNEFETLYAPEKPEMIYCKDCYQKEVG